MLDIKSYWIYSCTEDPRELISSILFGKKIARDRKSIARLLRLYLSWGYYMKLQIQGSPSHKRSPSSRHHHSWLLDPHLHPIFAGESPIRHVLTIWWLNPLFESIWCFIVFIHLFDGLIPTCQHDSTCPLIFPCIFPSSRCSNARVSILNPS